jgi:hypothetical protein
MQFFTKYLRNFVRSNSLSCEKMFTVHYLKIVKLLNFSLKCFGCRGMKLRGNKLKTNA